VSSKVPGLPVFFVVGLIVGMFTIPSISRYRFEQETLKMSEGKESMRVIYATRDRKLFEPLTWIYPPISSLFAVAPSVPAYNGSFNLAYFEYGSVPQRTHVTTICEERLIHISEPDSEGVLRVTTPVPEPMAQDVFEFYCDNGWSKELEIAKN
jgi:hypothetical protein